MNANKKYRIIYIIDGMTMGGAERLLPQIINNLNKEIFSPKICILQERGINNLTNDLIAGGIEVDVLNIKKIFDFKAIPLITKYIKKNKADILHTQLQLSDILGNISASLVKVPSICTIHTLISPRTALRDRAKQQLEWFVQRNCCRRIITVSEASRLNYLEFNRKCRTTNVTTIYNGINLIPFFEVSPALKEKTRRSINIPNHLRLLTTVAVLRKKKGIQYAIDALPDILRKEPNLLYLIIGEGPYRRTLENRVKEKKLQKYVKFLGQRDDIQLLLSISDVFLLPSLTEALPTVITEAMAAKIPVIATKVGGIPEMIKDNQNGLLISPLNSGQISKACQVILENKNKATEIGEAGHITAMDKFNISKQVQKLEKLYLEVIHGKTYQNEHNCC